MTISRPSSSARNRYGYCFWLLYWFKLKVCYLLVVLLWINLIIFRTMMLFNKFTLWIYGNIWLLKGSFFYITLIVLMFSTLKEYVERQCAQISVNSNCLCVCYLNCSIVHRNIFFSFDKASLMQKNCEKHISLVLIVSPKYPRKFPD
jgi:hypothetical protein